jgi:AraC family transcriptional regulator, arabinose operon regulatory protein
MQKAPVQPNRPDHDPAAGFPPDRHYSLGLRGFVHTSFTTESARTTRPHAVLLLSSCGKPFRLTTDGNALEVHAAMVGPQVMRSLDAHGVELLSLHLSPAHRAYPAFSHAFADDVRVLRRERFSPWDAAMHTAVHGPATLAEVSTLFEQLFSVVQIDHCNGEVPDELIEAVLRLIEANLDLPIDELARQVNLPVATLSHRFQQSLGLSLRTYQAWLRTARAWPLFLEEKLSLTDIAYQAGYADSSHMSRSWRQIYGVSPSYMRSRAVRVIR